MATLREIRRRISGVKSTQKITKAMKMVAAAKLRRAQEAVIAARPYARQMKDLLQHLSDVVDVSAFPLFAERELQRVAVIVVTADRGLCGAFNSNLIRATAAHVKTKHKELFQGGRVDLISVGRKGTDFFQKNGYAIASRHVGIFAGLQFDNARAIVREAVEGFLSGKYDRVDVVYNEFKSVIQQRVTVEQLLPIQKSQAAATDGKSRLDYIYEPSSSEIISALVPKHLNFQLWRILLESSASEQGARMTAMDNATTNASDLIRDLQLSYNKARQASITKELLEIVSGAEALKAAS
jgi:F-type H+-transporting ATPase subunit gamma